MNISILGSTGSIGTQALDVCKRMGFRPVALTANRNVDIIENQIREFNPEIAVLADEKAANELKIRVADTATKVYSGKDGVCAAAGYDKADIVLNSLVGMAGLVPTLSAIIAKKKIALANKETLVAGGDFVMRAAAENGVDILPVDSEHSAIFQCLQGAADNKIKKILLTASGGPFFGKTRDELQNVTKSDALRHPNWEMGAKITIDSATMMNKGFEVIEAMHLFGVTPSQIEVVVHRESIIHSAVQFADNSVIAQLGLPDMRLPIQYALTYPNRCNMPGDGLDLAALGKMSFYSPDLSTFGCLQVCMQAAEVGGLKCCAVNAANEVAVSLFLQDKIGFLQIEEIARFAYDYQQKTEYSDINEVLNCDFDIRRAVLDKFA
ncbi:MAG: 1-deoxy-D-xylulose-5-phosphate reductoisomerase [Acutalibacteraceae bacterium]